MTELTEAELNNMSAADIRRLADQEAERVANAEPEEVIYTRTVKDPDGVERVYHGSDPETLIDNIVQGRAEHQPTPIETKPVERTADEEFVLAQEFASSPSKAFRKMAAEEFGIPAGEVKERLQRLAEFEANSCAEEYVNTHPEFYPNKVSGARIQQAMREANRPITVSNIAKTVDELRAKGLIVERPTEIDPYSVPLSTLKNLANNTNIQEPEAGDEWSF